MRARRLSVQSPSSALELVQAESLKPHSDLTFRNLENLTIEKTDIRQSLFNGCLVRNCRFRSVDLSRCDLEQMQILNCEFIDVDFGNVELTSTQLAQCRFEECRFGSAMISECAWRNCDMVRCSFTQAVIQQSQFEDCRLTANFLQGASIQLDTFRRCVFEDMTLGDCTFLNQLLLGCQYRQVRINAESIGATYGLSEEDLKSFELVYLGQPVVEINATTGLLDALEKDYEKRRWMFMREMLRLNFRRCSRLAALDACLEAVLWPSSFGAPLKAGDITFLEMVILELFRRKELPGAATLSLPERIKTFQRGDSSANDPLRLQQLAARLRTLLLEMLRELEPAIGAITTGGRDRSVTARLVFDRQPQSDIASFIVESGRHSGLKPSGPTVVLREERGSYILVLQTTLLTLAGFQTALWLLNGCVAQMIELKTRTQVMRQKRAPLVIRERVLLPDQHIPKWMTGTIQGLFTKLSGSLPKLDTTAADLDQDNLRRVEVAAAPRNRRSQRATRKA